MAKEIQLTAILIATIFVLVNTSPANRVWVVRRDVTDSSTQVPKENVENAPPRIYSMEVVSDIRLRYASTKVTSRVANPAAVAQEAVFHIVLPDTAFISGFLMEIDGKVYKASVKEKEKAQTEYQNAVDSGQSAAQVTTSARDANQFTVSVNIEPQAKMLFNLTYEELLTRRRGIYEQAIHVNPGTVVPQMSVRVNIFETLPISLIKVPQLRGNDIEEDENSADDNEVAQITRKNETVVSVVYEPSEIQQKNSSENGIQGQFVVQYDVDRSSIERKGGEIHVVDGYFVHFFAPSELPILPKHVIFVLDTSGSMAGTRIEQTKQAMNSILDQLRAEDLFSVVEFSSDVTEWDLRKPYKGPEKYYYLTESEDAKEKNETLLDEFGKFDDIFAYPVTKQSVNRAKEFVAQMQVTSATNINDALLLALQNSQSVQSRLKLTPIIIFLTDGEPTASVTDIDQILANVRKANGDNVVSIFCLAFGTGTDFNFLTKVATQNRGFARKIYEAADATLQLKGFFDEVASPLLNNVRFNYDNQGPVSDVTETNVANFFKGTEFVVAGRVEKTKTSLKAEISGTGVEGPYVTIDDISWLPYPKPLPIAPVVEEKKFSLEKIWAYLTIQDMLQKRQSIDDVKKIDQFNEKALNLSLAYEFVTPLTSLVVVKPNDTVAAADVRPADASNPSSSYLSAFPLQNSPQNFNSGHRPSVAFAYAPAVAPDPFFAAPIALGLTTTYRPVVVPIVEEVAIEAAEESTMSSPVLFSPLIWIDQFHDNNYTHVNVRMDNETLSLLWQDLLPDENYDACKASYTKTSSKAFCKSIWKCSTLNRDNLDESTVIDVTAACVINDGYGYRYVGVCCLSPDDTASQP